MNQKGTATTGRIPTHQVGASIVYFKKQVGKNSCKRFFYGKIKSIEKLGNSWEYTIRGLDEPIPELNILKTRRK